MRWHECQPIIYNYINFEKLPRKKKSKKKRFGTALFIDDKTIFHTGAVSPADFISHLSLISRSDLFLSLYFWSMLLKVLGINVSWVSDKKIKLHSRIQVRSNRGSMLLQHHHGTAWIISHCCCCFHNVCFISASFYRTAVIFRLMNCSVTSSFIHSSSLSNSLAV